MQHCDVDRPLSITASEHRALNNCLFAVIVFDPFGESHKCHIQAAKLRCAQAAELFEVENSTSEANKCRLKIAQFSAELERFPVAIEIYENIAKSQVDNNLLKYSAKGNLLNAGLCRLNGKAVAPQCLRMFFHQAWLNLLLPDACVTIVLLPWFWSSDVLCDTCTMACHRVCWSYTTCKTA